MGDQRPIDQGFSRPNEVARVHPKVLPVRDEVFTFDSRLATNDDCSLATWITSPPSRLTAYSNEARVLVDGS